MTLHHLLRSHLALPIGILLLTCCGASATWLTLQQQTADGWVRHTLEVENALAQVRISALRARLVGNVPVSIDTERSEQFSRIRRALPAEVNAVTTLTSDNPHQQHLLVMLKAALAAELAHLDPAVGKMTDARYSRHVAALIDAGVREEQRLLSGRKARLARLETFAVTILIVSALLSSVLAILSLADRHQRLVDRRSMTDALAVSERRLSLITEEASDMISLQDADGTYLFVSPSSLKTLGRDPQSMTGHHPYEFIPVEYHALLDDYHSQPRTQPMRFQMWHNDGTLVWIEILSRLAEYDGKARIIVVGRDVSAQVKAEAELKDARLEAEAAAKAKSRFLADMSHEIRTPMNGVIGFTELILASDLTDEQRHQASLIAESGRAMMRLLNDVLDLSKVEAGQMTVTQEPFDLHHALHACAKLITPSLAQSGVDFHCALDPALPKWVVGDGLRLRQIVLNLLGNAAKFTAHGSVVLRAWATDDSGNAGITVEIADTGIGIAPERQSAIFEQFVQADGAITSRFGGTGLGLSISLKLAQLMGGRLRLTSMPGQGTSFFLDLPLVAAPSCAPLVAVPAIDKPTHDPAPVANRRPAGPSVRILVAEDHDVNRSLISAMLETLGYQADIAEDGASAVTMALGARARGRPFALVLMDVQMPVMDGLAAARRLRTLGFTAAELPILALTANAYADDVAECLSAGMQAHMSKPIKLATLDEALRRWAAIPDPVEPGGTIVSAKIRERYEARKAEALTTLDALVRAGRYDDAELSEVEQVLHKLAGTAGMFGDDDLGEEARALEQGIATWPPSDRADRIPAAVNAVKRAA